MSQRSTTKRKSRQQRARAMALRDHLAGAVADPFTPGTLESRVYLAETASLTYWEAENDFLFSLYPGPPPVKRLPWEVHVPAPFDETCQ